MKQLPEVISKLETGNIKSVGVSTRPRSVEGSYMPVFLAGLSFAETAAKVLEVPLYKFSHQDGHIMAGIISSGSYELLEEDFICVHLSGGTSEILKARYNGYNFDVDIVGGTLDISAGQAIDRVGVSFGLDFPCGAELERLALNADSVVKLPVSVKDGYFNFSGLETKALGFKEQNIESLSKGLFSAVGETVSRAINFVCKSYNINKILVVGGVASNGIIRNILTDSSENMFYFASTELSSDNACGIAALADRAWR